MIAGVKDWLGLIAVFIALGTTFYAWLTRRSKENAKSIQKMGEDISNRLSVIEKKLISDDRRIQRLEDDFKHLPTREQISEIKVALAQISATVDNTNDGIKRIDADFRNLKKDLK